MMKMTAAAAALLLIPALGLLKSYGETGEQGSSAEPKVCFDCHADGSLELRCENNETVPAFVDEKEFSESVHGSMACTECHGGISLKNHPGEKVYRSRQQLAAEASQVCGQCHGDDQIGAKPIHRAVTGGQGEKALVCSNCHGAHAVKPIAGGKAFKDEADYCLGCHGKPFTLKLQGGDEISLLVDAGHLKDSVHAKLGCSDCHFGFSTKEHPARSFKTARDFSISSSEICRRCHFDKYTKTLDSIHYAMISKGNQKAPVCTDCHGSHAIHRAGKQRTVSAARCKKCHDDVYEVYAKSVHGSALVSENNQDVPVCTDCHQTHAIEDPRTPGYHEKIPGICGNCHADASIMNRYGLSTDVLKTYLQDFHGVTLEFYRMQKGAPGKDRRPIAVCTDCHGIHDISRTSGPTAKVIKANLVKTCRRCHPGAGEDFPDAWISHYEPSLKRAPMVYFINLFYALFIPFMILGLLLQILLHIWRYAVNR